MNQLEYFLASTDGSRADVTRYMQQLRDLDEWVEYHLAALRTIAANRVLYLAAVAKDESGRHRGGRGGGSRGHGNSSLGGRGRGRGRGRGAARGASSHVAAVLSRHVYDVDAAADADGDGAADPSAADAAACMAGLQRAFEWHETCVRQHCQEREMLSAELAERCAEVRLSMASRLANFASVADVPVTELSS